MQTHFALVRALADGDLRSGAVLAAQLGISRAALGRAVHKAGTALGVEFVSERGRGYRLVAPLELLDPGLVLAAISQDAQRYVARLEIHDDIDSTNSHLLRAAHRGAPTGTLCLAERQSAGRGRHGRTWVSPFGANIYLSLLWRYPFGPTRLGGLSLAAGTAVASALQAEGVAEVALKWPNDILWRRRKLAGVLLEVAGEAQGPCLVVVGIGIDTHLSGPAAAAIDQPWVDMDSVLGAGGYSRNRLAGQVAEHLIGVLERYGREGFAPFLEAWEHYDRFRGEGVELRRGERSTVGIYAGITGQGALRLATAEGERLFQAGEVSLRPADETVIRLADT